MSDEICVLLWYYAASSGNSSPTFGNKLSVPSSRVRKSKNAARRVQVSSTSRRKPDIAQAVMSFAQICSVHPKHCVGLRTAVVCFSPCSVGWSPTEVKVGAGSTTSRCRQFTGNAVSYKHGRTVWKLVQRARTCCVLSFCKFFFNPMPHMSFTDFVVFPPEHGRSVTDF